MPPLGYYIAGAVIATIVLLVCFYNVDEEHRRLKIKQIAIWTLVFILATILWPFVAFLGIVVLFACVGS